MPKTTLSDSISTSSIAVDLDLTGPQSLHQLIDTSISLEGSSLLAEWLTQSSPNLQEIPSRQAIVSDLASMPRFRDRLLLHFRTMTSDVMHGEKLLRWLRSDNYPIDIAELAIAFSLTIITFMLFIAFNMNLLPAIWIFTLSIYALYYSMNLKTLNKSLLPFSEMEAELDKFRLVLKFIETYPMKNTPILSNLCKIFRNEVASPSIQLRQVKLITAAVGIRMNPLFGFLINLIIPWDFTIAYLAQMKRKDLEKLFPHWLDTFYKLEALSSLGNYYALNSEYQFPMISNEANPVLQANDIGHPLIPPDQRVCNDFFIEHNGSIAIITGSNMRCGRRPRCASRNPLSSSIPSRNITR